MYVSAIVLFILGYKCTVDNEDLRFCGRYVKPKPDPIPAEFTQLAEILMQDNNWVAPSTVNDGLILYLNLKYCVENECNLH